MMTRWQLNARVAVLKMRPRSAVEAMRDEARRRLAESDLTLTDVLVDAIADRHELVQHIWMLKMVLDEEFIDEDIEKLVDEARGASGVPPIVIELLATIRRASRPMEMIVDVQEDGGW